ELPEEYEVYPGHVAGSLCGAAMSPAHSSTIAAERRSNVALGFGDVQAFITSSASVSTPRPPTTSRVVAVNKGPFIGAPASLERLEQIGDATVLDGRPAAAHADGHVHGAFNVPVSGSSFATRAGFILDPEERIVIHATDEPEADRAGPVVTICESGTRASIAASVLAAAGVDARPVLHGGVEDWPGQTVSFRRCGERRV